MPNPITAKDFLAQLKADLIGKDSYRGVTLTYSWLANQFGHFSLGFIPTLFVLLCLEKCYGETAAHTWAPIIISVAWLLFETYNFLGPLLSKKQSNSKLVFVPKQRYTFQPAWGNIAFDTLTDLGFFWLGAFCCAFSFSHSAMHAIVLGILGVLILFPFRHWYRTKMFLQIPRYPFQFRLSQWDLDIRNREVNLVKKFLACTQGQGVHVLMFGSKNSGKTSLSVGIATELSIQHHTGMYTTAAKLYTMFAEEPPAPTPRQPDKLWHWRNASLLIIDDVNPGEPVKKEIVNAETFLGYINGPYPGIDNRSTLAQKNVIWIMGMAGEENALVQSWQQMLVTIGVQKENILIICL
jgi:hypothetical protein